MRGGRYLAVLAGLGILAAGCGTTAAEPVSLAAAVTRTTGQTARFAITSSVQAQGASASFTATGVFDFAHSRGMITMRGPVAMTEIVLSPDVYLKLPSSDDASLPRGKSWAKIDLGASAADLDSLTGPLGGEADPADLLASLTAVSSSVTRLGRATIRGVPVTGFRVNVDPAKAATKLPRSQRADFSGFASTLGSGTIPVDVWVDSQNLVRRVQLTTHLPSMGATASGRLVETTDFYDFGVPVQVSAPPAAQVATSPQIGKGGMVISGSSSGSAGSATSGASVGNGGLSTPPPVSGTLPPAQAAAAEQAVAEFWSALGRHDPAAMAQTVRPAERSCVRSFFDSAAPKITVTSLRITSAQPAGTGTATVRFTVNAKASLAGRPIPVFPQGAGGGQWLVATEKAGHWYVDLARSTALVFSGVCP